MLLTVFLLSLLRQDLEVQQPGLQPCQDKGHDGQEVPKCPLGQELEHMDIFYVAKTKTYPLANAQSWFLPTNQGINSHRGRVNNNIVVQQYVFTMPNISFVHTWGPGPLTLSAMCLMCYINSLLLVTVLHVAQCPLTSYTHLFLYSSVKTLFYCLVTYLW